MQVSIEKLEDLKRKMHIKVPADQLKTELQARLQKEAKNAKLKGFRPGKVPIKVIEQQYGKEIRDEVIGRLIQSSLMEALEKEKISMAGFPQIEKISENNELEYQATFEVYPEFTVNDVSGAKIIKQVAEIQVQDVEKVLHKLQEQYMDWVEVNRPTQNGDKIRIDFEGKINGEKFQGGSAKNFTLVLGSKNMIPGFEEGLIGKKIGESNDINVTFPENYQVKELAGKEATFTVVVLGVYEGKLPEVNDEFAKKLDIESVAKLREEVEKNMQRELEHRSRENLRQQVLKILEEKNPILLPQSLVDAEIRQMQTMFLKKMSPNTQIDPKQLDKLPREHFEPEAKRRVLFGLIFSEIIKDKKLTPDNQKVRKKLEDLAASYDDSAQALQYYFQNPEIMKQIEASALEEQVIDILIENAQVEEKKMTYDEIVNPKEAVK